MAVTTVNFQSSPRRVLVQTDRDAGRTAAEFSDRKRQAQRFVRRVRRYGRQAIANAIGPILLFAGLIGIFVLQGMLYVHVWRLPL